MYIRSAIILGLLTLISTIKLYSFSKDESASSIFNTPPRRFNAISRPRIATNDLDVSERSPRSCETLTLDTDAEEQERKISSATLTPLTPSCPRSTGILKSTSTSSLSSNDPMSPRSPKTVQWIDRATPTPTSPVSREHYWSPEEAQQYWDIEEANQDAVRAYVETAMPSQFIKHPLNIDVIGRLFNAYGYAVGEDKTKLQDYIKKVLDYSKEDLSEKDIEKLQKIIKSHGPQIVNSLDKYKPVKPAAIPFIGTPSFTITVLQPSMGNEDLERAKADTDMVRSWGAQVIADTIQHASEKMTPSKTFELARYTLAQQNKPSVQQELKKLLQERFLKPLPPTDPLAEQWQKLLDSF